MTQNSQVTLNIDGMTCASCVGRVEKSLSALEGISDVSVNLASESARLSANDPARLQDAAQALDTLGYPARTARVTLN
ncbi:heavy-metal-associated domain-containing protein [Falsiruegeria mediterranea]|uniref:Copper-transporting P-type ATPase n=1 Tax=Falsiruegeria mediterranea M17 TaxID=1200281 RepID=A0A2R8C292_9RHOB|nr:heavy metal-associated domain-containing protein [Falsiruegeria mediterranea]SPJ26540.1 Copper-transporting P-type ATPase [Falsiruegeria mediterranea M17]